jgi:hypothetical protein
MDLDPGWQDALLEEIRRVTADDSRVVAVQAYGSVAAGQADEWSDLDVAVRVIGGAAADIASSRWLSQFGPVWATDASASSRRTVMRVVYADGRRLDLSVAGDDQVRVVPPPALDRLAARTTRVRFMAALAVVRAARGDLLVATHLALGLSRDCLELALLLRDRTAANGFHDDHDGEEAAGSAIAVRVAGLLATAASPLTLFDTLEGAAALYDDLAAEVDPAYVPDWCGLSALLARARILS